MEEEAQTEKPVRAGKRATRTSSANNNFFLLSHYYYGILGVLLSHFHFLVRVRVYCVVCGGCCTAAL